MLRFKQIVIILFINLGPHLKGEDEVHEVPNILQKGITKIIELKERFGGMIGQMNSMNGMDGQQLDSEAARLGRTGNRFVH